MSMMPVLLATIAIFALVLVAMSIGFIFGRRGLRAGCCGGTREGAGCADHPGAAESCDECGDVCPDCDCRFDRAAERHVIRDGE